MKWLPLLVALFIGVVLGAVSVVFITPLQPSHSLLIKADATLKTKELEVQALEIQLSKADAEQKTALEKQVFLQEQVTQLEKKTKSEPKEPANNLLASITSSMLKQQSETKIIALKTRLKLSPSQEAALRLFMDQEAKQQQEMTQEMFSGKMPSKEELGKIGASKKNLDDTLKSILSPEQMKDYEAFQTEEKSQQNETMAQYGLSKITKLFPLNEDQKDKVYGILYKERDFKPDLKGVDPKSMSEIMAKKRHENLKNQLQTVLTPEQVKIWEEQELAQMKLQEEMVKKFTPQ